MRFCTKCGEPIISGENSCRKCGTQVRLSAPIIAEKHYRTIDHQTKIDRSSEYYKAIIAKHFRRKKTMACLSLVFAALCILAYIAMVVYGINIYVSTKKIITVIFKLFITPIWIAVLLTIIIGAILCYRAISRVDKVIVLQGKYLAFAKISRAIFFGASVICSAWCFISTFIIICYLSAMMIAGMWGSGSSGIEESGEVVAKVLQNLHNFYIAKIF